MPSSPLLPRPILPVRLIGNDRSRSVWALLDSGADRVIFPAREASRIGIASVESGRRPVGVGVGRTDTFYHDLALEIIGEGRILYLEVGFTDSLIMPVLGRPFFRNYREVTFREAEREVELRP